MLNTQSVTTFRTNLRPFVSELLSALKPIEEAKASCCDICSGTFFGNVCACAEQGQGSGHWECYKEKYKNGSTGCSSPCGTCFIDLGCWPTGNIVTSCPGGC